MITRPSSIFLAVALGVQLLGCSGSTGDCAGTTQFHAGSIEVTGVKGSARVEDLECVQVVTGSVTISDPAVHSLQPLSSLVHVLGDVTIRNAALQSLNGLQHLEEVGGELRLTELKELESLNGLEGLRKLEGALTISDSPKLASLEALSALDAIGGSLSLHGLDSVVTFEGLGAVGHIGGDLEIDSNAALTDVDAFKSLYKVEGAYEVSYNQALVSANFRNQDPSRLPYVGGDIVILGNGSLQTLAGFGVPVERRGPCDERGLVDGIFVAENDSLEVLELPDARKANVSIAHNNRLVSVSSPEKFGSACSFSLSSLPSLTSVGLYGWNLDSLVIYDTGLTTLDGFEQIAVNCQLNISKNAALVDAGALSVGGNIARWFDISQNPSLASCQVQAMVDALPTPTRQCPLAGLWTAGTRSISTKGNDDSAICE